MCARTKDGYDVFVDLPGFKKEDVKLDLQNGYLTITANRSEDLDEKDNEGRYIRQERCYRQLCPQLLCRREPEAHRCCRQVRERHPGAEAAQG